MDDQYNLVIERTLAAPRNLVWRAWTTPGALQRWWAPKPYETVECEIDLRPGGVFFTRMTGPDGFDTSGSGCFLDVVAGERIIWTNALLPGYRPAPAVAEDCGGFPFTAIVTFEDAGDGTTRYTAVAMHRNQADRDAHEQMGFHDGWGTCAMQLGQVAAELAATD